MGFWVVLVSSDDRLATRETVEFPRVTDHVAARHRERRAEGCRLGPRAAWVEATRLRRPHGLEGDEVRYHPGARVALVRKDRALVTSISVNHSAKPALQQAVRKLEVSK